MKTGLTLLSFLTLAFGLFVLADLLWLPLEQKEVTINSLERRVEQSAEDVDPMKDDIKKAYFFSTDNEEIRISKEVYEQLEQGQTITLGTTSYIQLVRSITLNGVTYLSYSNFTMYGSIAGSAILSSLLMLVASLRKKEFSMELLAFWFITSVLCIMGVITGFSI